MCLILDKNQKNIAALDIQGCQDFDARNKNYDFSINQSRVESFKTRPPQEVMRPVSTAKDVYETLENQ